MPGKKKLNLWYCKKKQNKIFGGLQAGLSHLNFNIFYAANQQIFMDGNSKKLKPQRIFAVNTIQNLPS
jgi:hypothetical protein